MADLSEKRTLLVFAHRGEAQHFLKQDNYQVVDFYFGGLYQSSETFLLITGEGITAASEKLAAVCGAYREQIKEVINFGIAGALERCLEKGKVHRIRTVYREENQKMTFQSFSSADSEASVDCLSASERILEPELAGHLACFAPIVDRELWAIGSVCKLFQLPFRAYKLISDTLEDREACEEIKTQAENYSRQLYQHFSEQAELRKRSTFLEDEKEDAMRLPDGFYMTTSQKRQLKSLFQSLRIRYQLTSEQLLEKLALDTIITREKHPKKRTGQVIEALRGLLNPLNTVLDKQVEACCRPLGKANCRVWFPYGYEKDTLELNIRIDTFQQLEKFKNALNAFPYKKLIQLLNGKIKCPQ